MEILVFESIKITQNTRIYSRVFIIIFVIHTFFNSLFSTQLKKKRRKIFLLIEINNRIERFQKEIFFTDLRILKLGMERNSPGISLAIPIRAVEKLCGGSARIIFLFAVARPEIMGLR